MEPAGGVDHEHIDVGRRRGEHALVVTCEQRAVEPESEPDAVRRRATQRLDETVVAATAAECVLGRLEGATLVLERRVAVVVETTDQLRFDRERDAQCGESRLHRVEMGCSPGAVEGGDARRMGDDLGVVLALRVEHAERVLLQRHPALRREVAEMRLEVRLERRHVARAVVRLAEAVEQQRDPLQPECPVELPTEGDDLDVEVRVVRAEHLDAHLVELPIPSSLGLLVAELRAGVPDLPGRGGPVLDECSAHRRSELWAQRDVAPTFVDEVVHLLRDDVGGVADALEHTEVLEQWRDHLAVPGPVRHLREHVHELPPPGRFGRKDVAHSGAGLELGHGAQCYRRAGSGPGECRRTNTRCQANRRSTVNRPIPTIIIAVMLRVRANTAAAAITAHI